MIVAAGKTKTPAAQPPSVEAGADASPYLAAVRQFADQALAHGRDTYGKPTPLFVDGINVDTLEPVKWKWADGKEWVLCNLASQQGLFRTLDGLSRVTGEPRYKDAALEALRYAFDHLRYGTENNGGLLAWGGHLAYNATDDCLMGNPDGSGRIHELKCFYPALRADVGSQPGSDSAAYREHVEWACSRLGHAGLQSSRQSQEAGTPCGVTSIAAERCSSMARA